MTRHGIRHLASPVVEIHAALVTTEEPPIRDPLR